MNKPYKWLLVLFLLLGSFITFSSRASAQTITSCQNLSITPTSGNQSTTFTITATCNNTGVIRINIAIADSGGIPTDLGHQDDVSAAGILDSKLSVTNDFSPGIYYVILVGPNDTQLTEPISFRITQDQDTPSQKACCSLRVTDENFTSSISTIIANEPNCVVPVGAAGANACPSICQAVSVNRPDVNLCAGAFSGNRALCDNQGNIGIDSAIGCIPFETAEATTAFLTRWALGIGGGVALFLIALSGIKIATTKGDPKRLQDARDTLTAAITGLVLIILSIFVVRFLSETLLALF